MTAQAPETVRPPQTTRARAALVASALVVVISLGGTTYSYLLPLLVSRLELPMTSYPLLYLPFQLVEIALAITALILGVPPLAGRGPRGIAGIAVGIAAAWLVSTLYALALGPILSVVM